LPRYEFTTGQVLTADQMNDLSDQTVMTFAGTAARGSAIPSPTEGMVTYRSDDNVVEVFDGSDFVGVGGGKILQVVSTTKTDTFTTSSTSFVDVTGLSVTITPTSATSKIWVVGTVSGAGDSGVANSAFRLVRDSTDILLGDAASNRTRASGLLTTQVAGDQVTNESFNFVDSPATTSAITYKITMRTLQAGNGYVNRTKNDTDSVNSGRLASTITVMEVAG
jgi:hypothetical protein